MTKAQAVELRAYEDSALAKVKDLGVVGAKADMLRRMNRKQRRTWLAANGQSKAQLSKKRKP